MGQMTTAVQLICNQIVWVRLPLYPQKTERQNTGSHYPGNTVLSPSIVIG